MVVLPTIYYCRWHLLIYVIFLIVFAGQATKQLDNKEGYAKTRTKESITSFQKNKNNEEEDDRRDRSRSKVDQRDDSPALNVFLENVLKARNELKWIDQAARSINLDETRSSSTSTTSRAADLSGKKDSSKSVASPAGPSKESDFGYPLKFPSKRGFDEYTNMASLPQKMKYKEGGSRHAAERVYLGREMNSKREVDRFDYNDVSRFRDRWKGNSFPASELKTNKRRSNDFLDVHGDQMKLDDDVDAINQRRSYLYSSSNEKESKEVPSFESLKKAVLELKKNLTENDGKARKGKKEEKGPGSRTNEGHVEETEGKKESHGRGEQDRNLTGQKSDPEGSDNYLNEEDVDGESSWWDDPRGVEEIFDLRKHEDDEEDDDEESEESESDAWRTKRGRGTNEKTVQDPQMFKDSYAKVADSENLHDFDERNKRKSMGKLASLNEYGDGKSEAKGAEESLNEGEEDKAQEFFASEKRKDGIAARKAEPMIDFESGIVHYGEVNDRKGTADDMSGKFSQRTLKDEVSGTRKAHDTNTIVINNFNELEKLLNSVNDRDVEGGRDTKAGAYNSENNSDAETKPSGEAENRPESGIDKNEKPKELKSRETDFNPDAANSGTMADSCEELKRCNNGAALPKHASVLSIDTDHRKGSDNCDDERPNAKLLMFDMCSSEKKIETEKAVQPNELISTLLDIKVEKSRFNSAGSDVLLHNDNHDDARLRNADAESTRREYEPLQRNQGEYERRNDQMMLNNFDTGRQKEISKRHNGRGVEVDEDGKSPRDASRKLLSLSNSDKNREDYSEEEFPGGVIQYYDYEVHDQPDNSAGAESERKPAALEQAAFHAKNVNEREATNQPCPLTAVNKKNENEEAVLKQEEERRKSNRTVPKEEFIVDLGESRPKNESEKRSEENPAGRGNEAEGEAKDSKELTAHNEAELKARTELKSGDNETPKLDAEFSKVNKGGFNDERNAHETSKDEGKLENVAHSDESSAKEETKLKDEREWKKSQGKFYKDNVWPRENEGSAGISEKEKETYKAEKQWPSERERWVKEENGLTRQEETAQHEDGGILSGVYHGKPLTNSRAWSSSGEDEHQQPFLERKKEFENDRESHIILIEPLENVLDSRDGLDSEAIGAFFGDVQPIRVFDRREQEASGNLYDDYDEQRHAAHYFRRDENRNQPNEMRPLYEELKSVNDWPVQEVRARTRIRGDRRMYDDLNDNVRIKEGAKEVSEGSRLERRHRRYSNEPKRVYVVESEGDLNGAMADSQHVVSRRKRLHRRGALSSSHLLNYEGSAKPEFNGRAYLVISSEELPAFNPGNSSGSNYLALKSTDDMFKGGGEQSNPIQEKSLDHSLSLNNTAEWKLAKIVEPVPVEAIPISQLNIADNLEKNSANSPRLIKKREKSFDSLNRQRDENNHFDSQDLSESFVESLDSMDDFDGEARIRLGRGLKTIDENSVSRANDPSQSKIDEHEPLKKKSVDATTLYNLPTNRNQSTQSPREVAERENEEKKATVNSTVISITENRVNKLGKAIDENPPPPADRASSTERPSVIRARAETEGPAKREALKDAADASRVKRQAGFDRSIYEDLTAIEKNYGEGRGGKFARSAGGRENGRPKKKRRKQGSARKKSKSKHTGVGGKSKDRGGSDGRRRRHRRHREHVSAGSPAAFKEYRRDADSSFLIAPRREVVNAERVPLKSFHARSYDASMNTDLKGPYGMIQGTGKLDDDTGRKNIAYLLSPDNTQDDSQMEMALRGQLAGKIVDSIFEQVEKNEALKNALGPGLYRRHKPEDVISTDKSYREGLDEDEVKRTEAMMKKVMEILGRLVLNEVQRRTCSALPPDLQDFLYSIVDADREEELVDEDHTGQPDGHEIPETESNGKFLFNKTDEESADDISELYRKVRVLKKLIDEYNALTDIERTKVQMVHDYLVRQVSLLLNYIEEKEKEEKKTASVNLGASRMKNQNSTRYNASGNNSTRDSYSLSKDAFSSSPDASTVSRVGNATFNFEGEHSRAAFRHAKLRKIRSSLGSPKKAYLGKHRKYRRRKPKHRKYRKHKREIKSKEEKRLKERSIVPEEYYRNDYDWLDLDKTLNFQPSQEEASNQKEKRQTEETAEKDRARVYGSEKSKRDVLSTSSKLQPSINPKYDNNFVTDFVKTFPDDLLHSRSAIQPNIREGIGLSHGECSTSEGPFYLNEGKQDFLPIKGKSRVEDELILLNKREAWKRENEEQLEEVAFGKDMRNKAREKEEFEKLTNMDKVKVQAERNSRIKREDEGAAEFRKRDVSVEATKKENIHPIDAISENPFSHNNSDDSHQNNKLSSEERLKTLEAKINVYADMGNGTTIDKKNQSISTDDIASRFHGIDTNNTSNFSAAKVRDGRDKRLAGKGFEKKAVYRYEFLEPEGELKSLRYPAGYDNDDTGAMMMALKRPFYNYEGNYFAAYDPEEREAREASHGGHYFYPVLSYHDVFPPSLYLNPEVPLRYRRRYQYPRAYIEYEPFKSRLRGFEAAPLPPRPCSVHGRSLPAGEIDDPF